jgi:hypothetical protein
MWLFDGQRYRAQGRSTLLAHVAIRLAMQGETIQLEDLTESLTQRRTTQMSRRFTDTVLSLCNSRYPGHRFEFDHDYQTLRYRGKHPQ